MEKTITQSPSDDEGPERNKSVKMSPLDEVSEETSAISTGSSSFVECPKQKVGSTGPIILSVIGYLNLPEQKSCRLVNRLWDKTASMVILQQDKSQVNAILHDKFDIYPFTYTRRRKLNYNVPNLVQLLKKSLNFPCTSFSFLDGSLDYTPVQQLFSIWEQKIKSLNLRGNCIRNTSESTFRTILLQLTNLEKLGVTDLCSNWGSDDKGDSLKLSNLKLKYLTVTSREQVNQNNVDAIKEILLASPNLTKIQLFGRHLYPLDVFVQTNTLHLISYGNWSSSEILDFNDKLFDNVLMPRLVCLKIYSRSDRDRLPLKRKMESYSKILMSSQDSLKELDISLLNPMEGLQIPILQNLKKLLVRSLGFAYNLPFGKQLDVFFPNVTTLAICESHLGPLRSIKVGQLSSVTTIEIRRGVSSCWIQVLQSLCPKTKTIRLWSGCFNFKEIITSCRSIWHRGILEEVIIYCSSQSPNIDSALTGLTKGDLTKLKYRSRWSIKESVNKLVRVSTSLLDISASKKLTFLITDIGNITNVESLPLSGVGIICASQIRPDVTISIGYDQNQKTSVTDYLQKMTALQVNVFHYKHNRTPYFIFPDELRDSTH